MNHVKFGEWLALQEGSDDESQLMRLGVNPSNMQVRKNPFVGFGPEAVDRAARLKGHRSYADPTNQSIEPAPPKPAPPPPAPVAPVQKPLDPKAEEDWRLAWERRKRMQRPF